MLSFHPDPLHHQALQEARLRQKTPDFKAKYAKRAGIEGTISQGVRGFDLRHARYRGLTKTRLQHQFVGASLNLVRMGAWLMETPLAQTRSSVFARVMRVTSPLVAA
jgi:transposase